MKVNRHKRLKMQIDRLLEANAKYQANNVCVTNTPEQQKEINDYCNEKFIKPIKDIAVSYTHLRAHETDS